MDPTLHEPTPFSLSISICFCPQGLPSKLPGRMVFLWILSFPLQEPHLINHLSFSPKLLHRRGHRGSVSTWPSQWTLPSSLNLLSPLHLTTPSSKLTPPWVSPPVFQFSFHLLESSFQDPFLSTSLCPPLKCCMPQSFL